VHVEHGLQNLRGRQRYEKTLDVEASTNLSENNLTIGVTQQIIAIVCRGRINNLKMLRYNRKARGGVVGFPVGRGPVTVGRGPAVVGRGPAGVGLGPDASRSDVSLTSALGRAASPSSDAEREASSSPTDVIAGGDSDGLIKDVLITQYTSSNNNKGSSDNDNAISKSCKQLKCKQHIVQQEQERQSPQQHKHTQQHHHQQKRPPQLQQQLGPKDVSIKETRDVDYAIVECLGLRFVNLFSQNFLYRIWSRILHLFVHSEMIMSLTGFIKLIADGLGLPRVKVAFSCWRDREPVKKRRRASTLDWDGELGPLTRMVFPLSTIEATGSRHVFLIRHGHYHSKERTDRQKKLTQLGREQLKYTGKRLKEVGFDYSSVVSSTMTRAKESANIILEQLGTENDDGRKEMRQDKDLGPSRVSLSFATDKLLEEGAPLPPEPPLDFWQPKADQFRNDGPRIEKAFQKYFRRPSLDEESSAPLKDSHEIIVCHANVIRYCVCRALQVPPQAWLRIWLNHGSITWLTIRPSGRIVLRALGASGFMPPEKLTAS